MISSTKSSASGVGAMKYAVFAAFIFLGFCGPVLGDPTPPVLYLAAPGQFPGEPSCPVLVRELVRQSLLIAARDELGLFTRDGVLREWAADADGNLPDDAQGKPALLLNVLATKDPQIATVELSIDQPGAAKFFTASLKTVHNGPYFISIRDVLPAAELMSRTVFVDELKNQGYTANIKPRGELDVAAGVDHLLYQTTLLSPVSALQQVHAQIRERGESPARLSALVRGYANLGELTRFQWSSIQKVMTARSLLYAQRMVTQAPDSPFSYYNRAYAFAMTGLHAAALEDLDYAEHLRIDLDNAGKTRPPVPKWVSLLDFYCKYDIEHLAGMAPPEDYRQPLIALMIFNDVENCGSLSDLMGMGQAVIQSDGQCFRIIDGLLTHAGLASAEALSQYAPKVMIQTLPQDIGRLAVIPQTTARALEDVKGSNASVINLAVLTRSFLKADECAEPSFALVGRILQETNFIHVMRRATYLADLAYQNSSDYLASVAPLVSDHPYRAYLDSTRMAAHYRGPQLKELDVIDPQWQMYPLLLTVMWQPMLPNRMTGGTGWNRIHNNPDATTHDVEQALAPIANPIESFEKNLAPEILKMSPYCPLAAATVIRTDFPSAQPHLDQWSQRFAEQSAFLAELSRHYLKEKQPLKAEPLLKKLVKMSPDRENIEMLARLYLDRDDQAQWLSTMKLVLDAPDYRQDHAYAQAEIAWHFMHAGQFDNARSFADDSNSHSRAYFAMVCDEFAAEYQGDFTGSEKIVEAESRRYSAKDWFYWCNRTGRGDVKSAAKLANDWCVSVSKGNRLVELIEAGVVMQLQDRDEDAGKLYQYTLKAGHYSFSGLADAMVCDEQHDRKKRDADLKFTVENCRASVDMYDGHDLADYAQLLLDCGAALPTDEQISKFLDSNKASVNTRVRGLFFSRLAIAEQWPNRRGKEKLPGIGQATGDESRRVHPRLPCPAQAGAGHDRIAKARGSNLLTKPGLTGRETPAVLEGTVMKRWMVTACCQIVCVLVLCHRASAEDPRPVFYLAASDQSPELIVSSPLIREIGRQALLIAARDEIGLYTHDAALEEWTPDAANKPPADALGKPAYILNFNPLKEAGESQVLLQSLDDRKMLLHGVFKTPAEGTLITAVLRTVQSIEPVSRKAFPTFLKNQGYTASIKPKCDLDVPPGVDRLLYQTTLLAPYSALQQVHAAIRESGESPQRLSALVRGYANLGELTRFQWCSIQKVMTARSLLYAQRMVNLAPDSAFSYYNRAYALAMTGLTRDALADLVKAQMLRSGTGTGDDDKPRPAVPKWVALIEPFCKCELDHLASLGTKNDVRAPLVALMLFIDVENSGSLSELMGLGGAALEMEGRCFRIMDGMMVHAGVISGHDLSERAPAIMLETLPDDIKLLRVVPTTTQQALAAAQNSSDHVRNLNRVCKSFLSATEPAEPSFALAGRMLQETNFVHVMRRATFMADSWNVDCSDYLDSVAPLIEKHPFRRYVESLKIQKGLRGETLATMEIPDPQWQMISMLEAVANLPVDPHRITGSHAWQQVHNMLDATGRDLEQAVNAPTVLTGPDDLNAGYAAKIAPLLLDISPYSGVGAGMIVQTNFPAAQEHLEEWTTRFSDQPVFLSALAYHWLNAGQTDKAEPLLKQLVAIAPDRPQIEKLARIYLARHDERQWLSTMNLVLKAPDYRLDHSFAEAEIAYHYMHKGDFNTARKYAQASYQDSGSEWSMKCLIYAADGQEDFVTAENVVKEEADRYDPLCWFTWCECTGHGDLKTATKIADQFLASHQDPTTLQDLEMDGEICQFEGDLKQIKRFLDIDMRQAHDAEAGIYVALLCAQEGDTDARDAALKFTVKNCRESITHYDYTGCCNYAQFLLDNGAKPPSDAQLEVLIDTDKDDAHIRCALYCLRGMQLEQSGDKDGAKKSYQKAIQQPVVGTASYINACIALRKMGEKTPIARPEEWKN